MHLLYLPPAVRQKIQNQYQVIDVFNFLEHDHDPRLFYSWCCKWASYEFKPNERIVILDSDSDYYPENSFSNNLYNFFISCKQFCLPTEFFIFASGSFNKHVEINNICKTFNLSTPTIIEFLHLTNNNSKTLVVEDLDFNPNKIDRLYSCLNGTKRLYRELLLCHLADRDLIKNGYVTYHFQNSVKSSTPAEVTKIDNLDCVTPSVPLRTTIPHTRSNEYFEPSQLDIEVYKTQSSQFNNQNFNYPELKNTNIWALQLPFLQKSLINLVTESAYSYPVPHPSEKLVKPILSKRGFILVGPCGLLKVIKEFGFKSFDTIWDESYDSIVDPSRRLLEIVNLLEELSTQDLTNLTRQVKSIAEYNFEHFKNNFTDTGLHRWFNNYL